MALTLFGIPNCDTVKKARSWLVGRGVGFTFHDYKRQGIDADTLARWADAAGWDRLVNRAGTTFRNLSEADKFTLAEPSARDDALALMRANPSMIRRPVVEGSGIFLVGFKAHEWEASFPA